MRIRVAACKTVCPQAEIGSSVLMSSGLAINWRHLISDSARPF